MLDRIRSNRFFALINWIVYVTQKKYKTVGKDNSKID